MRLGECCIKYHVNIPGSDLARSAAFIVIVLLLLIMTSTDLIASVDNDILIPHQRITTILCIFIVIMILASTMLVNYLVKNKVDNINNYLSIYYPKILLGVSVALYFILLSWWVFILGGVLKSPFASLLSVSPIILIIQYVNDEKNNYNKMYVIYKKHNGTSFDEKKLKIYHRRIRRVLIIISIVPIITVIAVLIMGEYLVGYLHMHLAIVGTGYKSILDSKWYESIAYIAYYLTVVIAAIGVLDPAITRKMSRHFI